MKSIVLFALCISGLLINKGLYAQKEIAAIFPVNGSTDVNVGVLKWSGADGCMFDIYFGTTANPPLYKDSLLVMEEKPIHLKLNQKYYWKIVEKKDRKIVRTSKVFTFNTLPIQLNSLLEYGTLIDTRDDKVYATLSASGKEWMAQNLDFEMAGKSYYYNDSEKNKVYGRLYSGKAVAENLAEICPTGWHLPTVGEWEKLMNNSGGIKAEVRHLRRHLLIIGKPVKPQETIIAE